MADLDSSWKLGEYRGYHELEEVEYAGDVADGDFLKITGVNGDGQMKVQKQTTNTDVDYIAPIQSAGASGDVKAVIRCAQGIKITFGGAVSTGNQLKVKANKAVVDSTSSSSNNVGFSRAKTAADGDTGVIDFKGGMP